MIGLYVPESSMMYQLNACAVLFLFCDSRGVSDPIAKTSLCWAIVRNCVEWIKKSAFEIHNQPVLYQHMFAVKQLYLGTRDVPGLEGIPTWAVQLTLGKKEILRKKIIRQECSGSPEISRC